MNDAPQTLPAVYRFNRWANEHIRAAVTAAGEERARRPLDLWFGSLFAVLAHLVAAEAIWLPRLRDGVSAPRLLAADDFPSLDALVSEWRDLDARWESYVATLSPAELAADVTWTNTRGVVSVLPRETLVLHVAFHSSEHRAQAALALTQLGISHGPQDFFLMPRDGAPKRA